MRFLSIAKSLALLGAVLLVAGPLGTRLGLWSFVVGFACFAMSGLCGLVALVLSLWAAVVPNSGSAPASCLASLWRCSPCRGCSC